MYFVEPWALDSVLVGTIGRDLTAARSEKAAIRANRKSHCTTTHPVALPGFGAEWGIRSVRGCRSCQLRGVMLHCSESERERRKAGTSIAATVASHPERRGCP